MSRNEMKDWIVMSLITNNSLTVYNHTWRFLDWREHREPSKDVINLLSTITGIVGRSCWFYFW